MPEQPRLYTDLSLWYPLLTAPEDYAEEAAIYTRHLCEAAAIPVHEVLELGCGQGANASFMKDDFTLTLTDRSPSMLDLSRALNPECEHVAGDMRTLRLGRTFDAVFIHDAIGYMTTEADVRAAIDTAAVHCRAGGAVLICPDHTRESYAPGTEHGGHDAPDGRGVRYLDWSYDPDPSDHTCISDYVYLLRESDGTVTTVYDRHIEGIFHRATWLQMMDECGIDARAAPFEHSEVGPGMELFVGRMRGQA